MIYLTVATYPRSGSNFLVHYLKSTTDINIIKTHHKIFNNKNIVTIVRDPFDTISSILTMQYKDQEKYNNNNEFECNARISKYKSFYNYILQNIDFIIDFNDIENKVDKISTKICNDFGGNKTKSIKDKDKFEWFKKTSVLEEGNIPTSKDHRYYELVKKSLSQYDLSECYELYNRALLKSVI